MMCGHPGNVSVLSVLCILLESLPRQCWVRKPSRGATAAFRTAFALISPALMSGSLGCFSLT